MRRSENTRAPGAQAAIEAAESKAVVRSAREIERLGSHAAESLRLGTLASANGLVQSIDQSASHAFRKISAALLPNDVDASALDAKLKVLSAKLEKEVRTIRLCIITDVHHTFACWLSCFIISNRCNCLCFAIAGC